jgi:hypothetical protein
METFTRNYGILLFRSAFKFDGTKRSYFAALINNHFERQNDRLWQNNSIAFRSIWMANATKRSIRLKVMYHQ